MQEKMEVEAISDCLGRYLMDASQEKNKDLFHALVQYEYDVEEEIYFQPGMLGLFFLFFFCFFVVVLFAVCCLLFLSIKNYSIPFP